MKKNNLKLFVCLVFLNFLSFSTYGIPIAYFPEIATVHGLNDFLIGTIFSMYPLFAFLFSFIVGKMLKLWNKKWILQISQIMLGFATLLFGFSYLFTNKILFIVSSMLGRALQGISIGTYQTAAYAYIPDYWKDEVDQRVCIMEISVAFGIGLGPLISSLIYETFGYLWIYVVPSGLIIIPGLLITSFGLPDNDDFAIYNKEGETTESERDHRKTMSVSKALFNKEIMYTFFSVVVTFTSFTLIMPMFELKIIELKESPEVASLIISFVQVGYGVGCVVLLVFEFEHRKGLFFIASFFNIVGLWLLGADLFIHMSNIYVLILMSLGLFIVGITCSLTMIPNFSQNISILKVLFPDWSEGHLVAMASGFFTAAISLAEFQGPIIGGILSEKFGFSKGCLLFSIEVMVFFLMFTFHDKGYLDFLRMFNSEKYREYSKLNNIVMEIEYDELKEKGDDLTSLNYSEEKEKEALKIK